MIDHLYYGNTLTPSQPSSPQAAVLPLPVSPQAAVSPLPSNSVRGIVRIDPKVIEHHLRRIYERENPAGAWIESGMYRAVRDILESAVDEGAPSSQQAAVSPLPSSSPSPDLAAALKRSADVFAAHKVHRIQQDMARLLVDDQGNLRSFREWRELVTPIAAHQVGPWLQTEYSTAVLRAQQAVEWQQFEAEADVLPNLRWVPSTAVHPGADHQVFWNTILPIHHPFWDQHRPGDRWNCKCSLEATDEQPTAPPKGFELRGNGPQPGLNENPAKTGRLFAQSHPYFPQSCAQCAFYQGGIASGFKNQDKDCQRCRFIPIPNESTINRERNLETYREKLQDPNYVDVEFDEVSGGVKATHEDHSFDGNKGWYEKTVQDVGCKAGHAVILGVERHNVFKGRNNEGMWDDKPFEIAGAENGTKTNIRNALKHCAKKPNVKIAVLFFPNNNFDAEELNNGLSMYCGLEGTSQYKEFDLIYCIQGNEIIHIKKAKR